MMVLKFEKKIFFIINRLVENLERNADPSVCINSPEMYINYCQYATDNGFQEAPREKVGQVIGKLFDNPEIKQITVDGVTEYHYMGLSYRPSSLGVKDVGELVIPETVTAHLLPNEFILEIGTQYIVDDVPLKVTVALNAETAEYDMLANGNKLDHVKLGFTAKAMLSQNWVYGMIVAAQHFDFCMGMDIMVRPDSTVHVSHTWKDMYQLFTPEKTRWHSKNCLVALPFTKNKKTETCRKCSHDLK